MLLCTDARLNQEKIDFEERVIWLQELKSKILEQGNVLKTYSQASELIAFHQLKIPFNKLLNEKVVFYFESSKHPSVHQAIEKRFSEISEKLKQKGLHLLYLPLLGATANKAAMLLQRKSPNLPKPDPIGSFTDQQFNPMKSKQGCMTWMQMD
jgi:hypothetical protein